MSFGKRKKEGKKRSEKKRKEANTMNDTLYEKKLRHHILSAKHKKNLYFLWKIFLGVKPPNVSSLKVLILNTPCMGFGDVVFAMKFARILKKWYDCTVKIASPQTKGFISLGEQPENLIELFGKSKNLQCRRLANFNMKTSEIFDIIFVAPLTADQDVDYKDVRKLIPYSNKFNTFFVSEYNDNSRKIIDFHTGIGPKKYGILLTDVDVSQLQKPDIANPYALVYVADSIVRVKSCLLNFLEMLCKKYNTSNFDIIMPLWAEDYIDFIVEISKKYFAKILVVKKDETKEKDIGKNRNNSKFTLSIRLDILPVPNNKMLELIHFSVKDILLTGDQSITDAISCCPQKNIFYQIAPWKEDFGKLLAKELPNKWLKKKSTSCGTIKAIKYNGNYNEFRQKWDFRELAKFKMDSIFLMTFMIKNNEYFKNYVHAVLSSGNLGEFFNKNYQKFMKDVKNEKHLAKI